MAVRAEDVRARVQQLADRREVSLASLSRLVGKNASYLQQFVMRGSPKRLGEDERLILAQFFGVDERELGAREPWSPGSTQSTDHERPSRLDGPRHGQAVA